MSIPRDFSHQWELGGAKLSADISPCSWMYPDYGLQLSITMEGGGRAYVLNKNLTFETASEKDALAMCQLVKIVPCKCCGKPAFEPKSVQTNRETKCEECFMAKWTKEVEELQKKEAASLLRRDKKHLKLGYTHRVTASIHPAAGGDDYLVDFYVQGKPTKASIQAMIKKRGSVVLDDYSVSDLEKITKQKE